MAANVSTNYVSSGYATQDDKINQLIKQYNANSDAANAAQGNKGGAWENNATQLALRGQNDSIAQQLRDLGVSSSYDAATGQTNFTVNRQQQPQNSYNLYAGTYGGTPIRDLYAESEAAAKAALKGAYDESVIALNAAKDKIPEYYQEGMNQAAANAAVARNNMNEYFAANGLNTGAAGQTQLSMQNQYQQSLNDLNTAEANALKDIETERYQLEARYKNAIAEAIANNNLEQAKALYQEYIRVDNNLVENSRLQAQLDYQYATLAQNQSQFDANLGLKTMNAAAKIAGNKKDSPTVSWDGANDAYALGGDDALYDWLNVNYKGLGFSNVEQALSAYNLMKLKETEANRQALANAAKQAGMSAALSMIKG